MINRQQFFNGPNDNGQRPWFSVENKAEAEAAEISIYDRIGKSFWDGGGTEAKTFAAELNKIPKDREIILRINSPGGSVDEGMTIYNRLAERRDKITVRVDGLAASIASVIALAGKSLEMPRNAAFMIHDPWGFVEGTAEEMRKAAETLDKYKDRIVSVYEKKTSAKKEDIEKWMSETTWYDGEEAKKAGFADTVTDEISFQACFDLSKFERVPEQLAKSNKKEHTMNREAIIAELNKLGVTFNAEATDEELQQLLDTAQAEAKNKVKNKTAPKAKAKAKVENFKAGAKIADEDEEEDDEEDDEDEASAPSNRVSNRTKVVTDPAVENRIKAIEAKYEAERKSRISTAVQQCVDEDKIPAAQAGKWVDRIMADESVLTDLQAMEPRRPGADPLNLTVTGEDPRTIENGLIRMRDAINSFMRGNHVEPKAIADRAKITAMTIARERKKLDVILNTNTIDPTLKRTVILTDVLRAFVRRLLILNVFTTKFENVPLQGTNKIAVPFYDLDETASTDYVAATGYTFAEDTNVGVRELTINKRKFKSMDFTSDTFRRQPYFKPDIAMSLKSEQLAVDVWTDILSIVKAQHYGEVGFSVEPSAFDSDDMARLQKVADDNDWPDLGRAFVGGTGHRQGLASDDAIKHWQNSGSTETLREGSIGRLSGFDTYFSPRIPANSEDLAAFICLPQAALVATAPVMPAPGVRQQLLAYEVVVDPQTGIAFEYRYGADVWKDTDREVVECNYGYAKGNGSALKRLTAGAGEFSSSSSASSVNSSSSSSSSASF